MTNLPLVIPTLFDDLQGQMDVWGKQGTIDPFKHIHDVRHIFSSPACNLTRTSLYRS
jgi:hypothetical protein